MSLWSYRIVHVDDDPDWPRFVVWEVYMDSYNQTIEGWIEKDHTPWGQSPEELGMELVRMQQAILRPVLKKSEMYADAIANGWHPDEED